MNMDIYERQLLTKFLDERCSEIELHQVRILLKQPDGEAKLHSLIQERDELMQDTELENVDSQLVKKVKNWKIRVRQRIDVSDNAQPSGSNWTRLRGMNILRYVAVFVGMLAITSMVLWQFKKNISQNLEMPYIVKLNNGRTPVRYILPDNSVVFLATGSRVSYPQTFNGKTREVNLEGEAFFEIVPDQAHPFIIHTEDINTQVLGTSFKVTAWKDQEVEISVATGKVQISHIDEVLATITPGNKITWYRKENKAKLDKIDVEGLERWKYGDMMFDWLEMKYIAAEIEKRYNVVLEFKDQDVLRNKVSGTFTTEKSLAQTMNVLSLAGKFRYTTHDNRTYQIYKIE